jgi:hypothetical protein
MVADLCRRQPQQGSTRVSGGFPKVYYIPVERRGTKNKSAFQAKHMIFRENYKMPQENLKALQYFLGYGSKYLEEILY